jgi:hypothetical protein
MQKLATMVAATFLLLVGVFVASSESSRLDVFHEIAERLNVTDSAPFPESKVAEFFHGVFHRIKCMENGSIVAGLENQTALGACTESLVSKKLSQTRITFIFHFFFFFLVPYYFF